MSVQTQIDRINTAKMDIATAISNKGVVVPTDTKIDSLASFIDRIETGAGGGESIDVCNVELISFNDIRYVSYTSYENGVIISKMVVQNSKNIVLNNVICGSAISFGNFYDFNGFTHSHDSQFIGRYTVYLWVLSAPTVKNVNATINIYDDD